MRRDNQDLYFHGGLGAENRRYQGPGNAGQEDFGRAYDHRDLDHGSASDHFRNASRRDYDMENSYYENLRAEQPHKYGNRQRYDNNGSGYGYDSDRNGNRQERHQQHRQQGYDAGKYGGYSGAAFGGANYSAHGSFGGSPEYGAMSGGGGNENNGASSSGYGNQSERNDRGEPSYRSGRYHNSSRNAGYESNSRNDAQERYRNDNSNYNYVRNDKYGVHRYGTNSGAYDRGGYHNYDPNNRWR
ncbi:hypothetical protein [Pontibacter chitinilyticus]|uniref:hypothetical protein n=1 Tax=Pontibacter chitinilyticus TaxID=2674989 RepID=UPI00321C39FD